MMVLIRWVARGIASVVLLAMVFAASPASAVRVDFNPVTVFPVAEGSPNLTLSLSATLEGTDCQPSLLRSISGGLGFSLEELPGQATASLDFVGGPHGVAVAEDRPGGVITIEFQAVLPGVILQDALDEPDEQIRLRLMGHTLVAVCAPGAPTDPAVTLAPTNATAIIQDDDSTVVVSYSLASGSYQVDDDQGQATVGVVVSGPPDDTCGALGFHYRVFAGTAETGDFTPVADQELALPAGATQASIPVAILPDSDLDDETVIVEIFQPKAGACDASLT
ncbi:MAG: hypothetical protein K8H90_06475, partial [Thermoanaerobaculia bacterium]|nr:hypothetical protein [Thermoanaerobaculia bacterium]